MINDYVCTRCAWYVNCWRDRKWMTILRCEDELRNKWKKEWARQGTINRIQRQSNQPSNFNFGSNFHRSSNHFPFRLTHTGQPFGQPLIILFFYFILFYFLFFSSNVERQIDWLCTRLDATGSVCIHKLKKERKKIWESVFQFWTWSSNLFVTFVRKNKWWVSN